MSDRTQDRLGGFVGDPAFLREYPYFAALLARLHPVADPQVDVMSVSVRGERLALHVNVDYFAEHPRYLPGVLLHELHHIVLGHLGNPKLRAAEHPTLMTLAMEVSANEYIREPLPGKPATWKALRHLGLRAGQSTVQRYEILVEARLKGSEPPDWETVDDHHPQGLGQLGPGQLGPGQLGPGQLGPGQLGPGQPQDHALIDRFLWQAVREGKDPLASLERVAAFLGGLAPGMLLEQLQQPSGPPPKLLDWNRALESFVGIVRTPSVTYSRPSRRFPEKTGQVPARAHRRVRGPAPPVIAVIDTSSSMSTSELARIARQLARLGRLAEVTVVECDCKIQRVYPFQGELQSVRGRGGTDLCPVFEPDFLRAHRPDGVIYFTDGEGPYPPQDPGVKTLWVLTKAARFGCPWGAKALLPDDDHLPFLRTP